MSSFNQELTADAGEAASIERAEKSHCLCPVTGVCVEDRNGELRLTSILKPASERRFTNVL